MAELRIDFYILKMLNYLSRYKRGDLIQAFFDAPSPLFGIHNVVKDLFGVDEREVNNMIAGKDTKDALDLIIKKLQEEEELKQKATGTTP